MKGIELSIIIPIYNDGHCVTELYNRLTETMKTLDLRHYELIFVDDGSTDNSKANLRELCKADRSVKMIGLSRNFGHQFAITAGLDVSSGDAVIVMDGDLQDPPEVIPDFVRKWKDGYDVVYGVRIQREGESRFKRWTASTFYRLLKWLSATDIVVDAGDFRLMSRPALETFKRMRERSRFVRGMVNWIGFPRTSVHYKRMPRLAGKSHYSLGKMWKLALDAIFSFSVTPLKMSVWIGFSGIIVCLFYLAYMISRKLFWGDPVQGWTSLMTAILFIGSLQLLVLGVIGEYVGRMYEELKGRPLYVVQERVGFEDHG